MTQLKPKQKQEKLYITIPKEIWKNKDLTTTDKHLWGIINKHSQNTKYCEGKNSCSCTDEELLYILNNVKIFCIII